MKQSGKAAKIHHESHDTALMYREVAERDFCVWPKLVIDD